MAMDDHTSKLGKQLSDKLLEISDREIAAIIRDAREEAIAEARAIVKAAVVRAVLEHALDRWEGVTSEVGTGAEMVGAGDEVASPGAEPLITAPEDEEQVQQEIAAIKQKIAQNERFLNPGKAPSMEMQEVQGPRNEDEVSASGETDEDGCGYYVYGIVGSNGSQPVQGLPEEGIDPACPVYALPHQTIQAIVSRVPLQEFGQEQIEANLEDLKWVEARVYAHEHVLETVLAYHNLVPMKFCTVYQSEGRVRETLAQYYDDLVDALARLEGKQEWGVKLYCDGEALARRIAETGDSDKVKELKAEKAKESSGAAYFMKKKMEQTIDEEKERVSDECAQCSHDRLSSHAEETVINPLQSKQATGRQKEMILNGAYLVAAEQLAGFRVELESLQDEYGELGFSYELTGPWPPYNFVTVGAADE